ncbi:MAG: hypothetical protein MUC95_08750, partial [Spirochaetes bacterium]|nr:hypothetical protein [Spirochaetota bacterium]
MTRLHKITSICFTLFILSSGISITFSQGMLILSLGLWLSGIIRKNPDFRYKRTGLEIYICQFIIVSAVLALLSQSRIDNLLYLKDFWLISAFVVAYSLIKTKDDLIKLFYLFVVVAAFQSAASFIQYFININYLNAFKYGSGHWQAKLPMGRIVMGFLGHHL